MGSGVTPQSGFEDKIQDNFPILKILRFDIGLNKILSCSAANSETFGIKNKNLMLMYWFPCQDFKYWLRLHFQKILCSHNTYSNYSMQTSRISHKHSLNAFQKN